MAVASFKQNNTNIPSFEKEGTGVLHSGG